LPPTLARTATNIPYILVIADRFARQGFPIISVDTKNENWSATSKTMESSGTHAGARQMITISVPMPSASDPYGIYDLLANRGSVFVGVSHDTAPLPPLYRPAGGSATR